MVNPDSNTVARLEYGAMHTGTLTNEVAVGRYPRTLALAGTYVFTAGQSDDSVWRLDQADLGGAVSQPLTAGCDPYGVVATPAGDQILVTCQGLGALLLLDTSLHEVARVTLPWPNPRALAVASDGRTAYVTHYLSEEPDNDAHVSVVDVANRSVARVIVVAPDVTTCETQNSGQGPLNLVSAIALVPDGAPAEVAGQLWIGGTQENNLSKGLFKRDDSFKKKAGAALFPWVTYEPFPEGGAARNIYKASFHDITRFGIVKLVAATGERVGKIDIDEANNATDIEFSADGGVAYVVDEMFNSFHLFNTRKGQGADVTTLFAPPSAFGPGGGQSNQACVPDALRPITSEAPFRVAPQAEIRIIDNYDAVDPSNMPVATGLDFDTAAYMNGAAGPPAVPAGTSRMRKVPDGVGTAPIGVRLSPDGTVAYVANYLARNVVAVASATFVGGDGKAGLRCVRQGVGSDPGPVCATDNDCSGGVGVCNHPGGPACSVDADCGGAGPCLKGNDCVPLILATPTSSITGDLTTDPAVDPLPAAILDGKNLFNTAARDASVPNNVGLGTAAPRFNDATLTAKVPGSVVSTSHDASYVTCSTCHADFGGQDGRTWDFAQFGAALRNTMDLRGRSGFDPGKCSGGPKDGQECTFDAACNDRGMELYFCKTSDPNNVPFNITDPADRDRFFNPMMTIHWSGDRDEVEDFEHTFRSLMGCGDCDSAEDVPTCQGCLIQRSTLTSSDPVDIPSDLGRPSRNIHGVNDPSKIVGIRLTHMADFVYSLGEFPRNPNSPESDAAKRGAMIFNDPQTLCASCHTGGSGGRQFFTDKKPNQSFNPALPPGADQNNPFVRHDVGTANLFDQANPREVANLNQTFQNPRVPIPGDRGALAEYVTPVLDDVWNTAPYLHDGTAHTLLDVVRPCDTSVDDCFQPGHGRNVNDQHGTTSMLTPRQLNDLVEFQKALSVSTVVGGGRRVINAGKLSLRRAVLRLPKVPKKKTATPRTKGSFVLVGELSGGNVDLAAGATVSLAAPAGDRMDDRSFTFRGSSAKRLSGHAGDGGGRVALRLKRRGDGTVRFAIMGRRVDVARFDTRALDTNPDITVAFEIGDMTFVASRSLKAQKKSKTVFTLPRRS
jgi:DNA-binding beta-propeller fold protein YncE